MTSPTTCPLCGNVFDAAGEGCRPSCPLAGGCELTCCPRCRYGFPRETGLARLLRRVIEGRRKER